MGNKIILLLFRIKVIKLTYGTNYEDKAQLRVNLNLKLWWENFIVKHTRFPCCNGSKVEKTSTDKCIFHNMYICSHLWFDLMEICLLTKLRICVLIGVTIEVTFFAAN